MARTYSWAVPSSKKTDKGTSYAGARWFVNYTTEKVKGVPGKTKVTWYLGKDGRNDSPKALYTHAKLRFTSDDHTIVYDGGTNAISSQYSTGKITNGSSTDDLVLNCRFDDASHKIVQGTFYIFHDTNGAAKFKVALSVAIYEYTTFHNTTSEISVATNYPYTKCKAPTSITFDKDYYVPGESMTISWSGAAAGNSNPITKYYVSYKIDSGDWSSTTTKTSSSTSSSVSIALSSSAKRDSAITVRVKTVGTVEGYNSDYAESSSTTMVNSLPSAPRVTVSIPSGGKGTELLKIPAGGERIITVTATSPDSDGHAVTIKYKINNGDVKNYTKPISVKSGATYEFYTTDNYETSSSVSKTFIANTSSPSFTLKSSYTPLSSANKKDGCDYVLGFTTTIKRSGGQTSGNSYSYDLYICPTLGGSYKHKKTLSTINDNSSSISWSITDLRNEHAPDYDYSYFYKIQITRNDGIETCTQTLGPF
jgi:hypothetical protein